MTPRSLNHPSMAMWIDAADDLRKERRERGECVMCGDALPAHRERCPLRDPDISGLADTFEEHEGNR